MAEVKESIEVEVPLSVAYNQWTQFEDFPTFMEGVKHVEQLDDRRLHWVAEIAGRTEEWDAEITSQAPDVGVAWVSIGGKGNSGVVTFTPTSEDSTQVMVRIDWEPEGAVEQVGAAVGADDRRVQGDLKRFKDMIETRGVETGGWRGSIASLDMGGNVDLSQVEEGVIPADTGEPYATARPNFARGESDPNDPEQFVEDRFSRGQEQDPTLHEQVHEGTFAEGQAEEEPHPEFGLHGRYGRGQADEPGDGDPA
jgi:hypothetical protein